MGKLVKGPWRPPQTLHLTHVLAGHVLADEIARMSRALEELRELHQRSERAARGERAGLGEARKD